MTTSLKDFWSSSWPGFCQSLASWHKSTRPTNRIIYVSFLDEIMYSNSVSSTDKRLWWVPFSGLLSPSWSSIWPGLLSEEFTQKTNQVKGRTLTKRAFAHDSRCSKAAPSDRLDDSPTYPRRTDSLFLSTSKILAFFFLWKFDALKQILVRIRAVGISFKRPQHKFFTACGTPPNPK